MGLFGAKNREAALTRENRMLRDLCERKDACVKELMSDGLRHGSPVAASFMAERREYLRGKR